MRIADRSCDTQAQTGENRLSLIPLTAGEQPSRQRGQKECKRQREGGCAVLKHFPLEGGGGPIRSSQEDLVKIPLSG